MEKIADSEDPNLDAIKRIVIEPVSISEEVNAVTHRQVTSDEKKHIIKTLLALPVGSKARSNAMDALHAELMAKKNPPTLSKSYRNLWSRWCSSYSEHTKVERHAHTHTHTHP